MKNRKFKTQNFIIINLMIIFVLLFTFEAKADLVDELIKKHKLDPKNNPKDQCWLMNELGKKTSLQNGGVCENNYAFCCDQYNNICEASVITYRFNYDEQKFGDITPAYYSTSNADYSTYTFSLIYNKKQEKVLGASVRIENGDDYLYDINELLKDKNFANKSELWIDIRNHPEFKKAKLQNKKVFFSPDQEANFDDGRLRFVSPYNARKKGGALFDKNFLKNLSYIKIRGCFVDEFHITNNPNFNHK